MDSIEQAREALTVTYRNWRGEVGERTITPIRVWFGATDWHPEPQWLLEAFDHDKEANRDFALKDFGASSTTPVDGVGAENERAPLSCRLKGPVNIEDAATIDAVENRARLNVQIEKLAEFIMAEVPGEPSQSEGAVDTAIRWMRSALASPEAEARLRERVAADVMALLQTWAGEIGIEEPGFWGRLASHAVLSKRAAEARLAQAEGGPEVTENMRENYEAFTAMRNDINEIVGDMRSQESTLLNGPEMTHECAAVVEAVRAFADKAARDRDLLTSAFHFVKDRYEPSDDAEFVLFERLEAALHPQSAAGEEGK